MLDQSFNEWLRAQSENSMSKNMSPNTLERWLDHLQELVYQLQLVTTMEPSKTSKIISQVESQIRILRRLVTGKETV